MWTQKWGLKKGDNFCPHTGVIDYFDGKINEFLKYNVISILLKFTHKTSI
jgi:hypothetical protein